MTANAYQYEWNHFTVEEPTDEGLLQIPIAGPPGTRPKSVRRHAGCSQHIVRWSAGAWGQPPAVPKAAPLSLSSGRILLRRTVKPAVSVPVPGKGRLWIVEAEYVYALADVAPLDGPVSLGDGPREMGGGAAPQSLPREAYRHMLG